MGERVFQFELFENTGHAVGSRFNLQLTKLRMKTAADVLGALEQQNLTSSIKTTRPNSKFIHHISHLLQFEHGRKNINMCFNITLKIVK